MIEIIFVWQNSNFSRLRLRGTTLNAFQTEPDWIGFCSQCTCTWNRSGTGQVQIQNWTCKIAVLDLFQTCSITVPCKYVYMYAVWFTV